MTLATINSLRFRLTPMAQKLLDPLAAKLNSFVKTLIQEAQQAGIQTEDDLIRLLSDKLETLLNEGKIRDDNVNEISSQIGVSHDAVLLVMATYIASKADELGLLTFLET